MTHPLRRLSNAHFTLSVSDFGAELQSLRDGAGRELLWQGDSAFWSGRAPLLFPIVGRAPEDHIALDGRRFPMAQHGFARRSLFELEAEGPNFIRHVLRENAQTLAQYPFPFSLRLSHSLHGAELTIRAEVTNEGETPMPFGLGFHPAFRWPLPGEEGRAHRIELENGAEPLMQRVRGGLLSAERHPSPFRAGGLELNHALFDADAAIFPEGAGEGLTYGVEGGLRLGFRFHNLPNLALWTKPDAPFICIEPWHGMAAREGASDEVSARPYSLQLEAGRTMAFAMTIKLLLD